MKSRVSWLLAVALVLIFVAGSPGAEMLADQPLVLNPTLHLSNGDYLAGELCGCAGTDPRSGSLRWQGSAFVAPLDFPLSAVSNISFPAGHREPTAGGNRVPMAGPRPDGPYCLELEGGDALFGTLVGLSSQDVQLNAPGLGLLHVERSAVRRIWHRREGADLVYLGPNGLSEWNESPGGAWDQDAGRLFTARDGASLVGELGLPKQACVDFELSWTSDPDFTWSLGTSAPPLDFDGQSTYVDLGSKLDFSKSSAFSVSFWMNSTGAGQQMIVGKGAGFLEHSAPGWTVFTANGGFLYFQLHAASEARFRELQAYELGTRLCDGRWHHVVVSYNGNQDLHGVAFYIDGTAQGLGADSNNLRAGSIGNDVDATIGATARRDGFYRGTLHEMQIFDRAITPADVARLYAGGARDHAAAGVKGLVAGYHLDAGRSAIVADFSGHGNTGTLKGHAGVGTSADSSQDDAAFRLEVLRRQLVLLRETAQKAELVPLQKINPGAGRCHFRIYLDQEHNRAIVFGADGGQLADLIIADAASHSGTCLRLINHRGNVRLEEVSITRWNGQPPNAVPGGKSELHRSDGSVVHGEIEGFDAGTKEFLVADGGRKSRVPADAVESIELSAVGRIANPSYNNATGGRGTGAPTSRSRVACSLCAICASGVRLSGDLRKVENGRLWLSHSGIREPLEIDMSLLRSLVVLENRKPFSEPKGRLGLMESDGLRLHGCLQEGGAGTVYSGSPSRLVWSPCGSTIASPLKQEFSGRIVYREAPPQPSPPPPTAAQGQILFLAGPVVVNRHGPTQSQPPSTSAPWKGPALYLRSGDTIACEVKRIDERGITFHSRLFDGTFVPHHKVKAVELENRSRATKIDLSKRDRLLTLPRMQKEDPPTHLIRSTEGDYLRGRLIEMDDKTLTVEVRLETRRVPRDHVASIIWLEKSGNQASAAVGTDSSPEKGNERTDKPENAPQSLPAARPRVPTTAETRRTNGVQALRSDGVRLTFRPEKLTGTTLQGTSDVLGVCRVELNEVDKLLIGQAIEQEAQALPYQRWNLQPAIEPKFAQADAKNGGTPGIESELVGKLAPDFELDTLDGPRFRLSDQRKKIVVLDFWATWCGPCMQSLPQLVPTVAKFRDRNVVLLAVNLQETPEAIKPVLERLQLKTNVGLDHNGVVAEKYAAVAIPQTVIIDAEGKIARLFVGGGPQYVEQLSAALEAVLTPAAVTPAIGQGK